ncbi:threonine transporter [Corynebacterium sp. 13CS0277]|uniref:LysE family translocator n=1 Tax=Corynebacterium sp. 13CS0277 TaxID=2071994 RepID=UPI000D02F4C7|nr:LysE family transporter [Corynebacterium sp. 13CS0277]PRQ10375.1 threonine transporter [Corynebacterium sp. 13CS0277]
MTATQLAALLSVWLAAITSPGPDTVQLARLATLSRRSSILGALGIMVGNTAWIVLSLAGMSALLASQPHLTHALEILGGSVLCWMGSQALAGGLRARRAAARTATGAAAQPVDAAVPPMSARQAFRLGLVTNLSNPKAIIFFGAVFAQFLTPDMGPGWTVALAGILISTGLAWFVTFALLATVIARPLARHAATIDMVAGVIFLGVGATLVGTGAMALF